MISAHLTEIASAKLKPANVLQAAVADLKLFERKQDREQPADPEQRYSFMSRHVRRAANKDDVVYLIALAYFEGTPGTDKPSTLLLYEDKALLLDTLIECLLNRRQGRDA